MKWKLFSWPVIPPYKLDVCDVNVKDSTQTLWKIATL